jgi:hypothetical protein
MTEQLNEYIVALKARAKNLNIQGQLYVSLEVTSIVHELENIVRRIEDKKDRSQMTETNAESGNVIDVLKQTAIAGSMPYPYAFGLVWAMLDDDQRNRVLAIVNTLEKKDSNE